MRKRFVIGAVGGALAAMFVIGAALAAVSNGSFETGLTGWSEDAPVEWVCGWNAADGNCMLDMGASPSAGKVSQSVPTAPGTAYTVTFSLAGNPTCTPTSPSWVTWITEGAVKQLRVSASGAASADYTFDTSTTSVSAMGWVTQTYSFTATMASTALSFENLVSGNCGPALDKVSISSTPAAAVPTSADQCKKGGWQALTDHLGNKFKNQGDCVSYVATAGKNLGAIAP